MDQGYWLATNCVFDGTFYGKIFFRGNNVIRIHFLLSQIGCLVAAIVGVISTGDGEEGKGGG